MDQYIGKFLDDRYEILDILGTGGMAVVYKAKCHRLNRMVAIKILKEDLAEDSEIRSRFHDESQAVAKLSHPNIVNVFDVNQSEGVEYIVMELIEGITLKQYMKKRGSSLNWREALHFTSQILQALRHAHGRGIIHRDIKPQNIMVPRDGSVKVADFGIARITDSQRTMTQEALGSVHYISPEQARGSVIDARSDLYSAGVVLYEMLTGTLPYQGNSPVAVALQHVNSVPKPPRALNPDIPLGMEQITKKAMAPDRDLRYDDADAMLADLDAFRKNPEIDFGYSDPWVLEGKIDEDEPTQIRKPVVVPLEEIQKKKPEPVRPKIEEEIVQSEDGTELAESEREIKKRTAVMVGAVAAIVVVVCLILFMLWKLILSGVFSSGETYTVPNLIGKNYTEAVAAIAEDKTLEGHFTIRVSEEKAYNSEFEPGQIIKQDPEADTKTKSEVTEITVVLCAEEDEKADVKYMPNIIGEDYQAWTQTLNEDYGVVVNYRPEYNDEYEKNQIIYTDPEAGTELQEGQTVNLYISKGKETKTVTMVSLEGMTQSQAKNAVEGLGLKLGNVDSVDSEKKKGQVVFQSVKEGAEVEVGTKVNIQISKGPKEPDNPNHNDDPDPSGSDDPDPSGSDDPEPDETKHQIKVNLPGEREEDVTVVIEVNGSVLYSKAVGTEESMVSVSYVGAIDTINVTVDGESYSDYSVS